MKFSAFGDLKSGSHTWIHNNCFASVFFVFLQFLEPPASSGLKKNTKKTPARTHQWPNTPKRIPTSAGSRWNVPKNALAIWSKIFSSLCFPHIGENIIPINQGQLDIAQLVPLPWNLPLCSTSSSVLDGSHRGHVQNCTPGKFGFQHFSKPVETIHGRFLFWWFQVLGGSSQLVRLVSG